MKNKWTVLLALGAVVFFLSHCGSETPPSPSPGELTAEFDPKALECLSGVYEGRADFRYDWIPDTQPINVSIAFSGSNAVIQVNGDEGDALCTHYAGIKTEENNGVVVLSAGEITSKRTEGTDFLGSDNVPQSFGNITLTLPKEEAESAEPAQETQAAVAEDKQDQNKCNFKIASFEELDSTPEVNTIDSEKLKQDIFSIGRLQQTLERLWRG